MIRRDHPAQARLLRVKAQGIDLSRGPWSTPGPVTSLPSLKDASPQGRAHAQSPGNPVRLLWLDESHDVIQTRIHDEMSQPLCLTPTQFGNYEVLRQQETPMHNERSAASYKRRLMHDSVALHQIKMPCSLQHSTASTKTSYVLQYSTASTKTPYVLSHRMSIS
jgi:hypothetical protein